MKDKTGKELVTLGTDKNLWEQFFTVFPLVIVGTQEADGSYDLAPKHLAMPMSWQNHFGFVCSPTHGTYKNIQREKQFAVSYPRPEQIIMTSLTASPRCDVQHKPIVDALPTFKPNKVKGLFIQDAYLYLECELDRIIDGFGENSLITGRIIEAHIDETAHRHMDREDDEVIHSSPLLAYLYPGRFARIEKTNTLPFPEGFKR